MVKTFSFFTLPENISFSDGHHLWISEGMKITSVRLIFRHSIPNTQSQNPRNRFNYSSVFTVSDRTNLTSIWASKWQLVFAQTLSLSFLRACIHTYYMIVSLLQIMLLYWRYFSERYGLRAYLKNRTSIGRNPRRRTKKSANHLDSSLRPCEIQQAISFRDGKNLLIEVLHSFFE